jgi:hypothetical protein
MTRIIALSDTHTLHNCITVPSGDVLIHSGDFTNQGTISSIQCFLDWFSAQPHKYKIFIAGNHELGLDAGPTQYIKRNLINSYVNNNLFYLENSSVTIEGIKYYGSPITPFFKNWAWNKLRGEDIAKYWASIPNDTNILITHGPPYGILDEILNNLDNIGRDLHQGCQDLLNKVNNLYDLKAHIFGHLHLEGGKSLLLNNKLFINAAICDEHYKPIRKPVEFNL